MEFDIKRFARLAGLTEGQEVEVGDEGVLSEGVDADCEDEMTETAEEEEGAETESLEEAKLRKIIRNELLKALKEMDEKGHKKTKIVSQKSETPRRRVTQGFLGFGFK